MHVKERATGSGTETGGFFIFNIGESTPDNDGTIIKPTSQSGNGRWVRINYDYIDPRWFGATAGGTADQTAAIQAAINYAGIIKKPVRIPSGSFNIKGLYISTPNIKLTGVPGAILKYTVAVVGAGQLPPAGINDAIVVGLSLIHI